MTNLNRQIERECAELAINSFMIENFDFGKYTFKSIKWLNNNTVQVTDRAGKKAKIKYDIVTDTVSLK